MTAQARNRISAFFSRRRTAALGLIALASMAASACAVQESNEYPIEIFSEMHYSQASRAQEPPRLQPLGSSVVFQGTGDPATALEVPATQRTAYDPARAAQLFSVNCAVCHGVNGLGDGLAEPHLTSDQSYYANRVEDNGTLYTGAPYGPPPNLQTTRQTRDEQTVFGIINSGIVVMPRFGELMSEEEIWQVVSYIFDTQGGMSTAQ